LPAVIVAAAGAGTMGPLVGVVLIQVFTWSDQSLVVWLYDRTVLAPVLAATWRCLPMAVLICWFAFGGLTRVLLDAARVDGAGPITRFVWVGVAQRTSALAVAWLVSLAIGCGELSATILVVPPGVTTIPIRVFGLLHSGVTNQAAAICLTSILVFFLVAAVIQRLSDRVFRQWIAGD
jgi:iron(III) transport system permease protein